MFGRMCVFVFDSLYMFVCMSVHVCVCVWVCACVRISLYASVCTWFVCVYEYANMYLCVRMCLCLCGMFVCVYLCMSVRVLVCTFLWTAIDRLSIIWKSDLTDKMKRSFFQAAVVSILLYGCTTWTLTKRLERRLDGNYTRMLRAVLNKSWRQHPTRLQLYGHLPPITKTIQVRRTRHAGHCWRSKDELISDVLLWTPTHGCASVGRPARTYIQQLCEDTGCNPEDLPEAMSDREKWRETVRDIRADGATWWWWWYVCLCVWAYVCVFVFVCVFLCVCVYVVFVCVCLCMSVCARVRIFLCASVCSWSVYVYAYAFLGVCVCGNLLSFLVRCGTTQYERGTQWDSNSLMCVCVCVCGNLLSFLLRCGTRPYERGTQWDSNSLICVCVCVCVW